MGRMWNRVRNADWPAKCPHGGCQKVLHDENEAWSHLYATHPEVLEAYD